MDSTTLSLCVVLPGEEDRFLDGLLSEVAEAIARTGEQEYRTVHRVLLAMKARREAGRG